MNSIAFRRLGPSGVELMMLVMVFLYKHLLSLLTFFWLTSILHHPIERMRRQSLLREQRSRQALADR